LEGKIKERKSQEVGGESRGWLAFFFFPKGKKGKMVLVFVASF